MILKDKAIYNTEAKRAQSGQKAEKQMAYYLDRAFGQREDVFVINDLRLANDYGMATQIDHLVLSKYGITLIESKSVYGKITVNSQGEWSRTYGKQEKGVDSPILQVKRQKKFLYEYFKNNIDFQYKRKLKFMGNFNFDDIGVSTLVAISETGIVERIGKSADKETSGVLLKADQIVDAIETSQVKWKKSASALLSVKQIIPFEQIFDLACHLVLHEQKSGYKEVAFRNKNENGYFTMVISSLSDFIAYKEGLRATSKLNHQSKGGVASPQENLEEPRRPQAINSSWDTHCKKCKGNDLVVQYGRFGYFYACQSEGCDGSGQIVEKCGECGSKMKIRKKKDTVFLDCKECNSSVDSGMVFNDIKKAR